MLRGELPSAAGGHADDERDAELAADMWRMVAALFMIWSSASRLKLTVMISTIGRMPASAAPMPAPTNADSDSGVSRMRSSPKFRQQILAHGVGAAVAADVLAHQEHARVARERLAQRNAQCLAIGGARCGVHAVLLGE